MSLTRENDQRTATTKNSRVDLRIPTDLKEIIEQAAALVGQSVSAFMLGLAVPRAREIIREADTLTLTARDRDRFMAAIDDVDAEPNAALRQAAERYKAAIG